MALIRINHKSSILGKASDIALIVPEKPAKRKLRVLYLLHGLSDDYSAWLRYTSIERYLKNNTDTIVVMPDAQKSFYTDMAYGNKYYTYITEEIPEFLTALFNVSSDRADTYIAGLSMGGYGAFKIALKNPDKFFAAASFSGALDIEGISSMNDDFKKETIAILGDDYSLKDSDENLLYLIDKDMPQKPELLQMCGTEDFLYQFNQNFKNAIKDKGFKFEYHESPGFHNWDYWDYCIKYALNFFGIENK